MPDLTVECAGCHRTPDKISEYSPEYTGEDMTAREFVISEEGTYNRANGHFWCTSCYIKAGMPLGVAP
jgi:hypothetical protein